MGQILVGTSGFSYSDWQGVFYPDKLAAPDRLAFYATRFPIVELDFSYYQMPTSKTMLGLAKKTPDHFLFCVKAHKSMTHEMTRRLAVDRGNFQQFRRALAPLGTAAKLGCVLAQFPWGYKYNSANLTYLDFLRDELAGLPVVVEFRNGEWVRESTFNLLKERDLGFGCVDEPRLKGLVPPVAAATSDLGYLRFHGRNAAQWWHPGHPGDRYNYQYSREELQEWLPPLLQLASQTSTTFVLFNNCHAGQAVINARLLREMLGV